MPPSTLSAVDLRRLCPRAASHIIEPLARNGHILTAYQIDENPLRWCHFLAQAAFETDGFRTLVEYGSTAYFARRYGHRSDLGNRHALDGSRFRGRGIFQLTGRHNYRHFGKLIGIDLVAQPSHAADPAVSLRIACAYWHERGLNQFADNNDIMRITRRINGGYNGLRGRKRLFRRALRVWGDATSRHKEGTALQPILRRGATGLHVRLLQNGLKRHGARIVVDGRFGVATHRALRAFQSANGLAPDGIAGPLSWAKLQSRT